MTTTSPLAFINIKILDHVIVGRPKDGAAGELSLREAGLCSFA